MQDIRYAGCIHIYIYNVVRTILEQTSNVQDETEHQNTWSTFSSGPFLSCGRVSFVISNCTEDGAVSFSQKVPA